MAFFFCRQKRLFFLMCWLKNFTLFLIRLNLLKPDGEVHIIKITPAFLVCINPRLSSYCRAINPHIYKDFYVLIGLCYIFLQNHSETCAIHRNNLVQVSALHLKLLHIMILLVCSHQQFSLISILREREGIKLPNDTYCCQVFQKLQVSCSSFTTRK